MDHHQILLNMGIDPATQGYARHENTHRTRTIDYAIVLEGEIDMLLDDTEVHVKAGDILVQQGTNHAWVNNSGKPCRIAFILIDGKTPPAWSQGWKKQFRHPEAPAEATGRKGEAMSLGASLRGPRHRADLATE